MQATGVKKRELQKKCLTILSEQLAFSDVTVKKSCSRPNLVGVATVGIVLRVRRKTLQGLLSLLHKMREAFLGVYQFLQFCVRSEEVLDTFFDPCSKHLENRAWVAAWAMFSDRVVLDEVESRE